MDARDNAFPSTLPRRTTLPSAACSRSVLADRFKLGLDSPATTCLDSQCCAPDGELVKAGGRVVKNVTGYDLMRLWSGSLGTLGVITEVALRVVPVAETTNLVARSDTLAPLLKAADDLLRADFRPEILEIVGDGDGWLAYVSVPAPSASAASELLPGAS